MSREQIARQLANGQVTDYVNCYARVGNLTVMGPMALQANFRGDRVEVKHFTVNPNPDLSVYGENEKLACFKNVDKSTGMPTNSAVFGLLMSALWLLYFYGGAIMEGFGPFKFDSSELPIITLYALYIPIYIALMTEKTLPDGTRMWVGARRSISC